MEDHKCFIALNAVRAIGLEDPVLLFHQTPYQLPVKGQYSRGKLVGYSKVCVPGCVCVCEDMHFI